MKKIKFKCFGCEVTVKRPGDRIIKAGGQCYCSEHCKDKDTKKGSA